MKGERLLRRLAVGLAVMAAILIGVGSVGAQVAGSSTIGVSMEELKTVAVGWSAKKGIMGKPVYNDTNQKIGAVDDLIVTPDQSVSYAIIGVGGFLGLGKHEVAVPMSQLKEEEGKLILPGATKDALKAMPKFEYAKK